MTNSLNLNQNEIMKESSVQLTPDEKRKKEKDRNINDIAKTLSIVVKSYIPSRNGQPIIVPDNFIKSAKALVRNSPVFDKITDKDTIVSALLHCASDGLLPDGKQATLVTYRGKLTYVPMYQGLVEIIYRGKAVQSVNTHIIYDSDKFEVMMGTEERIIHIPDMLKNGNKIAVYAVATLNNGGKVHCLLKRDEIELIKSAQISKMNSPQESPWVKHEDEMWKKTAIRRLYKIIPKSSADIVQQRSPEEYEGYVPVMHDDVIDISHMNEAPEPRKVTNVNATLEEITND